jgi:AcrR family transcriptional regulator
MPKRSREYMDGQRQRFCEAAIRCFKRRGVVNTNLTMICDEAGLSIGAFYKLFGSREDLLAAVYLARFVDRNERLRGESWSELRAAMLRYREVLEEQPFWREMDAMTDWDPRLMDVRLRQAKVILEQIEAQLARFQAAGEIRPVLDLGRTMQLITVIFDGATSAHRQGKLRVAPVDLERFLDLAVGAPPPTVRKPASRKSPPRAAEV